MPLVSRHNWLASRSELQSFNERYPTRTSVINIPLSGIKIKVGGEDNMRQRSKRSDTRRNADGFEDGGRDDGFHGSCS
jgi:hypothetical protein